ncbi:MAG: hypothetical protein JO094_11545 [Hyphomicrobiales bacterium]|nr:hypothetical protein [Hyphomicrobiales bacterium]
MARSEFNRPDTTVITITGIIIVIIPAWRRAAPVPHHRASNIRARTRQHPNNDRAAFCPLRGRVLWPGLSSAMRI